MIGAEPAGANDDVVANDDTARVIGGAHSRPPLSGGPRPITVDPSAGSHANSSRPAARPATRAPAIPPGPVLLPPAERPPARAPGARRADRPPLVGPDPHSAAVGRRIASPPPARTPAPPAPVAPVPEAKDANPIRARSSEPEHTAVLPAVAPLPTEPLRSERPPPIPVRSAPSRARSRQRSRARIIERPAVRTAEPAKPAEPAERVRAPRPVSPEPDVEAARARYLARSRSGVEQVAAVLPIAVWSWLGVLVLGGAGVVAARTAPHLPSFVGLGSACLIAVALSLGLAVRTGGRIVWASGLSAVLVATACLSGWAPLIAGASVGTGVLAATLAVMATTPASTFADAIREALVATVIAGIGSLGVVGFGPHARPQIDLARFDYVVLGLSLAGAFALVYRLGAGLHGLGRRGYVVAGGAVLMLALALAYSEALSQWGSRELVGSLDNLRDSVRSSIGAVPHPIVAVLGYPALLWGVFMRARRRQGWWVTAFGVAATAPTATRLAAADVHVGSVLLGMLYSLLVGILVGYLVIRAEQSLSGSHGRRARRDEEAVAHRPEPSRTHPLH